MLGDRTPPVELARRGEDPDRAPPDPGTEGDLRRVWVRGHENVRKRLLIQAAACNIGLLLRRLTGVGTPRSLQGRLFRRFAA